LHGLRQRGNSCARRTSGAESAWLPRVHNESLRSRASGIDPSIRFGEAELN
jgi:hypothetical protein